MAEQIRSLTLSVPDVDYWRDNYNLLTIEQELNNFGQFMIDIDGVDIT